MFVPPVAKPKSAPPKRPAISAQQAGRAAVVQRHPLQRAIGDQSARLTGQDAAPSWDFSKVPIRIQAKLEIGAADDPLEHEADRVADQLMQMPAPQVAPASTPPQISRKAAAEAAPVEAPDSVHEVLRARGNPLDASSLAYFEPRFGQNFSHVRVHVGAAAAESARGMQARAYTAGHHIVYGPGEYAPETARGKRLIAHELAHVVQQGASERRVQRFTEPGHKLIGDAAFGIEPLKLGELEMTFGDAVALGDYFGSFEIVRDLAKKPGKGRNSKGLVLYVLWEKIHKHKQSKLGEWYDKDAVFQADQISRSLDSKNISHFPNPQSGDPARDPLQKNQRVTRDKKPFGAAATYRQAHEQAMEISYINGTHQQGNDDALLADGFACHFLTDSFSASHLRTPRDSIKVYWDKKVPGFRQKLINWLADQIDRQPLSSIGPVNLAMRFFAITGFPFVKTPNSTVRSAAVTQLSLLLSGGDFSFGDVVSLIVHDAEGAAGVEASIDGKHLTLAGDKNLVRETPADPLDPAGDQVYSFNSDNVASQTAEAAIAAVKASIEDIHDAYFAGLPENLGTLGLGYAGFGDLSRTTHHKDFNTMKKDALGRRNLYRAELLVPTAIDDKALPADKKTLPWMQESAEGLLDPGNAAIGKALVAFGAGEAKEFQDRLKTMTDLKPEHRAVLERVLIAPLASGDANLIRTLLKSILAGTAASLRVGPQGVEPR